MMYNVNVINLFQPVLDDSTPPKDRSYLERAQFLTASSHRELRRLLALQEARHCWGTAIAIVLHPITVASVGSLDEISRVFSNPRDAEKSEAFQGLLVCLRALTAVASYTFYAQPLFRLVTEKCQALGLQLPEDLHAALDQYTSEEWTRNAANVVSSQYIADMRRTRTDSESARMDSIISAWEGMSINEAQAKGKARSG
jgi:hypothetical protein